MIRLAVALPSAGVFNGYRAMAAPSLNRVKITAIRAMAIQNIAGNCLVRIDTDSSLAGYREAGATGPMARARIATMRRKARVLPIVRDEFRPVIPRSGCSPAEPVSASPAPAD